MSSLINHSTRNVMAGHRDVGTLVCSSCVKIVPEKSVVLNLDAVTVSIPYDRTAVIAADIRQLLRTYDTLIDTGNIG